MNARNLLLVARRFAVVASLPTGALLHATEENWPQWRGPDGAGVASTGDYPVKFSATEGVVWSVALPGRGCSTPAVWGDQVFVTCGVNGQDALVCYDFATGKLAWEKQLSQESPGKHRNASGSNSSPATDGRRVVAFYRSGTLACFDLAGKKLWQANLQDQHGKFDLWWDFSSTPVLAAGRVVVAVMTAGESYLAAYDLKTGDVAWKQPRKYQRPAESDQSYTTPQVAKLGDREAIVTFGADHLTGHDAATGELLWDFDGFNPRNQGMWRSIASPAVANGIAVVPYGRGGFLAGIRLPPGDAPADAASARIWEQQDLGADVPSPAIEGQRVYLLGDDGRVTCLDLTSGMQIWRAALPRSKNKYYASPVVAGDLFYAVREDGAVFVARVGDEFMQLSENSMNERIIASPVAVRGDLLLRGEEHLFRVEGESETGG